MREKACKKDNCDADDDHDGDDDSDDHSEVDGDDDDTVMFISEIVQQCVDDSISTIEQRQLNAEDVSVAITNKVGLCLFNSQPYNSDHSYRLS